MSYASLQDGRIYSVRFRNSTLNFAFCVFSVVFVSLDQTYWQYQVEILWLFTPELQLVTMRFPLSLHIAKEIGRIPKNSAYFF